ncbi:MAG: LemA family protein [Clostridia bacterium]|nr:LemA family protein [Clostridia bacterium]
MGKTIKILIVAGVVILLLALMTIPAYNGFVNQREIVSESQSNIHNQLQRRADLIPNFVQTVKGYSDYEQKTLTAVTEARAAVAKASSVAETQKAADDLNKAISVWVNAVTEAYPDLKANEQYVALQDELAGTENRIARARQDYNKAAQEYNVAIQKFPGNIVAGLFGFHKADYFENDAASNEVPKVSFE